MKYAPSDGREKKEKKGRGSSIQLFSLPLRQLLLEKTSPPVISLFLLLSDPKQFYYCRIQHYFSTPEASSYQENECWSWNVMPKVMQKWEFSIKLGSVFQKVCVSTSSLWSPWQPANIHQVTICEEVECLNIAKLEIILCLFQNPPSLRKNNRPQPCRAGFFLVSSTTLTKCFISAVPEEREGAWSRHCSQRKQGKLHSKEREYLDLWPQHYTAFQWLQPAAGWRSCVCSRPSPQVRLV